MSATLRVAFTLEQCWHRVPGGTAVAALRIGEALARRDDVEPVGVAAAHRSRPPDPWTPTIATRHLRLPRLLLYEAWHRWRRPRVESATGPVDVVHATALAIPPRSAPLVVTIHDLLFRRDPALFTARGVSFLERGLRVALREADAVLCPSRATLEDCRLAGFEPERLRHIPMGVVVDEASEQQVAEARRRFGLERPYALWVGTVEPRKNLPTLLLAFDELDDDLELVLVGPRGWNEDLTGALRARTERVKLLGFVSHRELGALYAGARLFCLPSLYEGFGLPVLEAMAQGTPVVTSRGTSTEEVAGDAALLVDPRDPSSIAAAMKRIVDNDALAKQLAESGRLHARAYSWDRTAGLTRDVYAEVAT